MVSGVLRERMIKKIWEERENRRWGGSTATREGKGERESERAREREREREREKCLSAYGPKREDKSEQQHSPVSVQSLLIPS